MFVVRLKPLFEARYLEVDLYAPEIYYCLYHLKLEFH